MISFLRYLLTGLFIGWVSSTSKSGFTVFSSSSSLSPVDLSPPLGLNFLESVFKVAEANEGQGVDGASGSLWQELLDASSTGTTKPFAASVDCEDRFLGPPPLNSCT